MNGPEILIPLAFMMIPIVAILTSHQRKMAELINQRQNANGAAQHNFALENEVRSLRESVNSLTLTVEMLKDDVRTQRDMSSRLKVGE